MKKKIIVKGPALSASGYGEHARFVLRSLREREDIFDIYFHNLNWGKTSWIFEDSEERRWLDSLLAKTGTYIAANKPNLNFDASLQVTIPNEFENIAKVNIGVTAGIETTKVSPEWLEKTNQMDKLVVVSNHAKRGFEDTKYPLVDQQNKHVSDLVCQTPIEVVGYPIKKHKASPAKFEFDTDFNFLNVALWGQRKNIHKTIENFLLEFKDEANVGLVLKTALRGGSTYDKIGTENILRNIMSKYPDSKCKIYLLHGRLTEEELTTLYNHDKIKCMISLAHGEGFGLPLFEAAYNGLPIVTTDWSGHLDFLYAPQKDKKGKEKLKGLFGKVSYDLHKVQAESVWEGVITPDSMWAYPKDNSAREKMRNVYKDYQLAINKAKKLKTYIEEEFSSEKMMSKMSDTLVDFFKDAEAEAQLTKENIHNWREEASKLPVKERISFLTEKARTVPSQEDKIDLLKDTMKGETCYLLSCGPTLLENNMDNLKEKLSQHACMSIKQSYLMFEELTDIHVYNCANFKKYEYGDNKPLVVEASTAPGKLGECDLNFFIQERDFKRSVSALNNFDEWTLDKQQHLRPYGPGIMTEIVIYLIEHMGFSEVITVGYDNKIIGDDKLKQHFYTKEGQSFDKKDFITSNDTMSIVSMNFITEEEKISQGVIEKWYSWLKERGCTLKICSSINPASEDIERIKI